MRYNVVSVQKRGILVEIKACEKFYRRHIIDIPRIIFFSITRRLSEKGVLQKAPVE